MTVGVALLGSGRGGRGRGGACTLDLNQQSHTIDRGKHSPLTFPVAEATVPDAVEFVVDILAVLVVSFESPVALTAVVIPEVAEVGRTTTEEVCVVTTPELFVSERVVWIDSLGGLPVEAPKTMFHC